MDLKDAVTLFESKVFETVLEDPTFVKDDMSLMLRKTYNQMVIFLDIHDAKVFTDDVIKYALSPIITELGKPTLLKGFEVCCAHGNLALVKELHLSLGCATQYGSELYMNIIATATLDVLQWLHTIWPIKTGKYYSLLHIEAVKRSDGVAVYQWLVSVTTLAAQCLQYVLQYSTEELALWIIDRMTMDDWMTVCGKYSLNSDTNLMAIACANGKLAVVKILHGMDHVSSLRKNIVRILDDPAHKYIAKHMDVYIWLCSTYNVDHNMGKLLMCEAFPVLEWLWKTRPSNIIAMSTIPLISVKAWQWLNAVEPPAPPLINELFQAACANDKIDLVEAIIHDCKLDVLNGFNEACNFGSVLVAEYLINNHNIDIERIKYKLDNLSSQLPTNVRMIRYLKSVVESQ